MISMIFFIFLAPSVLSHPIRYFRKIDLPSTAVGPFCIIFDHLGRGLFTGISDGRIVRYDTLQNRFIDFAFTGPNRTKAMCDGTNNNDDAIMGGICGRPLGLAFYFRTNQLYVTDPYHGLLLVEPFGGLAAKIATCAEGVPFKFPFNLDVDQDTGDVYFTDFSTKFNISQIQPAIDTRDSTGRLVKYTRGTGEVTVLLRNLSGAAGVVISHDKTHILVSEFIANRTTKFWLSGPKAFTASHFAAFRGRPINIKKTNWPFDYWVTVTRGTRLANGTVFRDALAVRVLRDGTLAQTEDLSGFYPNATASDYVPIVGFGSAYVGSLRDTGIGRIN